MKKTGFVFILLCLLILGVMAGVPSSKSESEKIQEQIEGFEESLKDPNYEHSSNLKEKVKPNLTNEIAKGGEKIVTSIFDYALRLIGNLGK